MRRKTLEELKSEIKLVNENRRLIVLANIERLNSRKEGVNTQEVNRLTDLIYLQNTELDRLNSITDEDVDDLAKERFDRFKQ